MKKLIAFILGIIFAVFFFFLFKTSQFYQKIYSPQKNHIEEKKDNYNILLLGYAGGKHDGAYLTDTMMIFHLNLASKSAVLISIPRDLWIKIPTKTGENFYTKINNLYQIELFPKNYPALSKTYSFKKIFSSIFGLPIDNYVAINFEGFKKAIDILRGVDINVDKSFTDYQYPIEGKEKDLCDEETEKLFKQAEPFLQTDYNLEDKEKAIKDNPKLEEFLKNATSSPHLAFPCRYETLVFKKGKTHMDGETALKYVRSRHSADDGSDFGRARRQQLLLEAVKEKVLSLGVIPKIIPLLDQLGDNLKTDISFDQIKKFTKEAAFASQYQVKTFVLSTENYLQSSVSDDGQYILIPQESKDQWGQIQKAIQLMTQGINPSLSPTIPTTLNPKND